MPSHQHESSSTSALDDDGNPSEAPTHFAWSTTLRRAPSFADEAAHLHQYHHHEPGVKGVVERSTETLFWLAGKIGIGGGAGSAKEKGYDRVGGDGRDETPSERFAALSVEVSTLSSPAYRVARRMGARPRRLGECDRAGREGGQPS